MKDYFGNEINIGDTILYVRKGSHGYNASFTESIVTEFASKTAVSVMGIYSIPNGDRRLAKNVINLTALGIKTKELQDGHN